MAPQNLHTCDTPKLVKVTPDAPISTTVLHKNAISHPHLAILCPLEAACHTIVVRARQRMHAAVCSSGVLQSQTQACHRQRLCVEEGAVLVGHHLAANLGLLQCKSDHDKQHKNCWCACSNLKWAILRACSVHVASCTLLRPCEDAGTGGTQHSAGSHAPNALLLPLSLLRGLLRVVSMLPPPSLLILLMMFLPQAHLEDVHGLCQQRPSVAQRPQQRRHTRRASIRTEHRVQVVHGCIAVETGQGVVWHWSQLPCVVLFLKMQRV